MGDVPDRRSIVSNTSLLLNPPNYSSFGFFFRSNAGDRRLPDPDRDPPQGHGGEDEDPLLSPPRLPRPPPPGQDGGLEEGQQALL